ncbi:RING finger protein 32-like [Clavelina lepadiformis]|uniref:RING finger protein 32-like n=1 Tax=Clavelina lepadiformis TaxID=159417 RepID=UPI0040433075
MEMNTKEMNISSTTLAAVALQDHLLQDLQLGDLSLADPFNTKKHSLSQKLRFQEKQRKNALKNIKATVNTGLKKKKSNGKQIITACSEEKEYVLDPHPKPLSLAQKIGLVPYNKDQKQLLTEAEWSNLKQTSTNRDDFKNPCAICKDEFRLEHQVLLSCSHVFHKVCLQAFERFTGRKSCPMCRHNSYQTRVVHDGTKIYKHKSAARIQAFWRGYVVRKWYKHLRKTVPPKDPNLRKKFYQDKLSEITDRLVAMTSTDYIDRFLSNIDQSVSESRNVFQYFDKNLLNHLSDLDWREIEMRAFERGATECPICLRCFSLDTKLAGENPHCQTERKSKGDFLALLSCSHVFHAECLNALEIFSLDDNPVYSHEDMIDAAGLLSPSIGHKCPVCRSLYSKRIVSV